MGGAAKIESYYIDLVFPLIGSLYAEALIIGVFVVGFGMLRQSLRNPLFFKEHAFYQRGSLLLVVMVWTANLHASYGLYGRKFDHGQFPLLSEEAHILADLTRVMIPLEITATIVTALMFGAIAFRDYSHRGATGAGTSTVTGVARTMKREISLLFWLAACSHLLFMLWFIIVYGLTGRIESLGSLIHATGGSGWDASPAMQPVALNVAFHFLVALIYTLSSVAWRLMAKGQFYERNFRAWDWAGAAAFCFIMINVYWFRLGQYISNMGASPAA